MIRGKLKKTINEKCPNCKKKQLQIRIIEENGIIGGLDASLSREVIICPSEDCDFEKSSEEKISRRKKYRKEE